MRQLWYSYKHVDKSSLMRENKSSKENIVEDQTTPFDSFVNEDALRYYLAKSTNELENRINEISNNRK